MVTRQVCCALTVLLGSMGGALAQSSNAVPVTVDNFIRAESDLYFGGILKDSGGIGKFLHRREPARIDNQTVIRLNRDTLYSSAVFDLDAGPVTITLPDAGKRFMSMQVINEDHYVPDVVYGKGSYTLTRRQSRHALRRRCGPNAGRSGRSGGREESPCASGCDQGQPEGGRQVRSSRIGTRRARRRCATRCSSSARRSPISRRRSAPRPRSIRYGT